MEQHHSSALFDKAIDEFSKLPGIGRKTAERLTLHILRRDEAFTDSFCKALSDLRHNVRYCNKCHNISDCDICNICSSPSRNSATFLAMCISTFPKKSATAMRDWVTLSKKVSRISRPQCLCDISFIFAQRI